jgi:hypothetical protein
MNTRQTGKVRRLRCALGLLLALVPALWLGLPALGEVRAAPELPLCSTVSARAVDLSYAWRDKQEVTLINNEAGCVAQVGFAAYEMTGPRLADQRLFAVDTRALAPQESATLRVDLPGCRAQIDLFVGPVIQSLAAERYGERLLHARFAGEAYCAPLPPPTPTATGSPSPTAATATATATGSPTTATATATATATGSPTTATATATPITCDVGSDTSPPRIELLTIDDGAAETFSSTVALRVVARDSGPCASGVSQLLISEYTPQEADNPSPPSRLLRYASATPLPWSFLILKDGAEPLAGAHLLRVSAIDRDNNQSAYAEVFINYLPARDRVELGEARSYLYRLSENQPFGFEIVRFSGRGDLIMYEPPSGDPRFSWDIDGSETIFEPRLVTSGIYRFDVRGNPQPLEYRLGSLRLATDPLRSNTSSPRAADKLRQRYLPLLAS